MFRNHGYDRDEAVGHQPIWVLSYQMPFKGRLEWVKDPTIRLSRPQGTELMEFERQFQRIAEHSK